MGDYLNVNRIVTKEFKKEFRFLNGNERFDKSIPKLRKLFDLTHTQSIINEALDQKKEINELQALRKYHRNNLRYLARYFAQTLSNQLRSSGVSLYHGVRDESILKTTHKTFKSNPQSKQYH